MTTGDLCARFARLILTESSRKPGFRTTPRFRSSMLPLSPSPRLDCSYYFRLNQIDSESQTHMKEQPSKRIPKPNTLLQYA